MVKLFSRLPRSWWLVHRKLPTTGSVKDPVSELNRELWNSFADDKDIVRKHASFYANIYVVQDNNPQND